MSRAVAILASAAPEEEFLARRGQRQSGNTRTSTRQRRGRALDNEGIMPVLARAVREVETGVQRGHALSTLRPRFQAIALLVREERARVKTDTTITEARRAEQLKRLDGVATILAKTAASETSLLSLLADDAVISDAARALKREMREAAGEEPPPDEEPTPEPEDASLQPERRVVPRAVISRQLASPFMVPDFSAVEQRPTGPRRLATWELLGPLLRAFETGGASSCMDLPDPTSLRAPGGLELMRHQAQVVAAAEAGHRTFLLADEPGLGKTAQALLAAQAAGAYPLLAVVPNVVKTNWAREAGLWTPDRAATVIHSDGETIDALRRHRRGQLRDPRPARRLARGVRVPRHGRGRGALHQEQDLAALPQRAPALRADPGPDRAAAADGADRHAADQRHRGLPGDLGVPRAGSTRRSPVPSSCTRSRRPG